MACVPRASDNFHKSILVSSVFHGSKNRMREKTVKVLFSWVMILLVSFFLQILHSRLCLELPLRLVSSNSNNI